MLTEWLTVSWLVHCDWEIDMKWPFESQFLKVWIEVVERTKLYWVQVLMYYEEERHVYMSREELKKIINLLVPTVSFPIYSKFGIILKSLEWLC